MCFGLIASWCVYGVCIIRDFTTRVKTHVRGPRAETTGTKRELVSSPAPLLSDHKSGAPSQGPTGTWHQSEVAPGNWGGEPLGSPLHHVPMNTWLGVLIYYWYKQRYLSVLMNMLVFGDIHTSRYRCDSEWIRYYRRDKSIFKYTIKYTT